MSDLRRNRPAGGQRVVNSAAQQKASARDGAKSKGLLGFWTEVYQERDGEDFSTITNMRIWKEQPMLFGKIKWAPSVRRFSTDKMESGLNRKGSFPMDRTGYRLDVDGKPGTIDFVPLDKKKRSVTRGLYLLRDDLLILVWGRENGPRPECFTTSKAAGTYMLILRRGKLEPYGEWDGRADRLGD